jgi:hypothetical protein
LFLMSTLTWDSRSCFTTSEWPHSIVRWRGVLPNYKIIYYSTLTTAINTMSYSSSGYTCNSPLCDMYTHIMIHIIIFVHTVIPWMHNVWMHQLLVTTWVWAWKVIATVHNNYKCLLN